MTLQLQTRSSLLLYYITIWHFCYIIEDSVTSRHSVILHHIYMIQLCRIRLCWIPLLVANRARFYFYPIFYCRFQLLWGFFRCVHTIRYDQFQHNRIKKFGSLRTFTYMHVGLLTMIAKTIFIFSPIDISDIYILPAVLSAEPSEDWKITHGMTMFYITQFKLRHWAWD